MPGKVRIHMSYFFKKIYVLGILFTIFKKVTFMKIKWNTDRIWNWNETLSEWGYQSDVH